MLQLDVHSNEYWQAIELAGKLHDALKDSGYKRFLRQCNMTIQSVDDTTSHNTIVGTNYDYAYGCDATFQIISGYTFESDDLDFTYSPSGTIDSASFTDSNDLSQIDTQK